MARGGAYAKVKGRLFSTSEVSESETLLMPLKPEMKTSVKVEGWPGPHKAGKGLKKRVEANNEGSQKKQSDIGPPKKSPANYSSSESELNR